MRLPTKIWPSATVLLTGLSGSGKTTMCRALVRRLTEYGIKDVVMIDGEELRARLPRRFGHSLAERDAVWREIVKEARRELDAGKIVVVGTIAHRASMRAEARKRLQPFFEVHLDCPVEVCATRDRKGHYPRALAGDYDCFVGVTHPYERSDPVELRMDMSALSEAEAETLLAERVIRFLSAPEESARALPLRERLRRRVQEALANSPFPWGWPRLRRAMLRGAESSKPVVRMERASCAQLMVSYGGMDAFLGTNGMVSGMSPLEFLRLSGLFGRNLLWIRDPYGEDFVRGINADLRDYTALAKWTCSYAKSLPHVRETHAIGYSSGGYGALMFGHLCRMQTAWAFAPRTARLGANAAKTQLKELLSKHNGVTEYHIWYSALNRRDRAFGEFLAECPGVTLHPCRECGDGHFLLRYLAEHGILRTILPPFVPSEVRPPGFAVHDQADEEKSS